LELARGTATALEKDDALKEKKISKWFFPFE